MVTPTQTPAHVEINNATSLTEPIQLIRTDTGKPCKAYLFADIEGMSPAYLVTDEHGAQDWVPVSRTVVADSRFLSATSETLRDLSSKIGKSGF